jgi:hypothetical protein
MKGFKVILNNAEITLPGMIDSNIIVKGKILLAFDKYDIVSLLDKKNEELVSSRMRINLDENEVYVFQTKQRGNHVSYIKRGIILPFSFQYTTTETVFFEKTNSFYLSKRDSNCIIGQVLIRASAVDSITFTGAVKTILEDMKYYRRLNKFPESSGYTENIVLNPVPTIDVRFLYERITIIYEGLQFKSINDFSGLSIPFLDFSLYSDRHSELKFEKNKDLFQGRIKLYLSANYFNSRASMWEPIIESWPFTLDIDMTKTNEMHRRIDIISDKDLNFNFSDEQVQILLTAYYDWMQRFQEISEKIKEQELRTREPSEDGEMSRRSSRTITSFDSAYEKKSNEVEYVSPYTIWNDTGYKITVKPLFRERKDLDITLVLESGDERDLLMESSIHKIFESSSNQNVLNSNKAKVEIAFPGENIELSDIDVHNIGSKSTDIVLNSKRFPVVCSVYNYRTKKLVRFSSTLVIKNLLNVPFFIKIHENIKNEVIDNQDTETLIVGNKFETINSDQEEIIAMEILPNTSKSLPVDKLESDISFNTNYCDFVSNSEKFNPLKMECYDQTEICLGFDTHAILRVEAFRGYHIVYVEPLMTIKNCLPITVDIFIQTDNNHEDQTINPQETFQILNNSSEITIDLVIVLLGKGLKSNKYQLQPYTPQSSKELYLEKGEKRVNLDIFVSPQIKSYTRNLIFYAKVCIINETVEKLFFYSEEKDMIITGHEIVIDGLYCYIFNEVPSLCIRSESNEAVPSEPIILSRYDSIDIDLEDSPSKYYNVVVKVGQELVGKKI